MTPSDTWSRAELKRQADQLAGELAATLESFLGRAVALNIEASEQQVSIAPPSGHDVSLSIQGRKLLSLELSYKCHFDHRHQYLAVKKSHIKVHAGQRPQGEPLFRYEYVHNQQAQLPSAHLHVHGHRDQFTRVMTLAGEAGAHRRKPDTSDSAEGVRMARIHFPLGGPRFRPCLEDVLQMLEVELGVETGPQWPRRLLSARANYRRQQTGAVVRDCPGEAVRVLRELGYQVMDPTGGAASERLERLQAF